MTENKPIPNGTLIKINHKQYSLYYSKVLNNCKLGIVCSQQFYINDMEYNIFIGGNFFCFSNRDFDVLV